MMIFPAKNCEDQPLDITQESLDFSTPEQAVDSFKKLQTRHESSTQFPPELLDRTFDTNDSYVGNFRQSFVSGDVSFLDFVDITKNGPDFDLTKDDLLQIQDAKEKA